MIMRDEIKAVVEAILFLRSEHTSLDELAGLLQIPQAELKMVLEEFIAEYNQPNRGIQIVKTGNSYLMCTRPEYSGILAQVIKPVFKKLSSSSLETLAIIAYRQPITRVEIERIRGVKSEKMLRNLLDKGLIEEAGYKDTIGRPIMYATTSKFLHMFGLASLDDLPVIEEDRITNGKIT
jgi:segregation and condensation protein B